MNIFRRVTKKLFAQPFDALFRKPHIARKSKSHLASGAKIDRFTILEGNNSVGKTDIRGTQLGFGSYIGSGYARNGKIGRYSSIGHNFTLVDGTHPINFVSTYPGFYETENKEVFLTHSGIKIEEYKKCSDGSSFIIGNDVWIGANVQVLGGITIGDGSVVGAGAVVTKDVPPYSVIGGVPAKIIRPRFDEITQKKLLQIKWWEWNPDKVAKKSTLFNDVEKFIEDSLAESQENKGSKE